jgi:cobyrinic acid a,c-diamide synthase|tara:strand:+ start:1866 stop:3245 length:1380 start_codon:yes stop_codon:yes gene_type:complete
MEIPRILISGTSSRVGKTMISVGLMRAILNRGYVVQPYKIGPDFIDTSFHFFATGRHSRNLDGFMMGKEDVLESFQRNAKNADIAIVEGAMGLYDSGSSVNEQGSSAEASKIIKAPVILIANVERIARSAAPFVLGYKLFDPMVNLQGVILNRAGSSRHASKVREAVEGLTDLRVLGVLRRNKQIVFPERHLGLVPAFEKKDIETLFNRLARIVEDSIDVDAIIEIARSAPKLRTKRSHQVFNKLKKFDVNVGIIRDKAFTFYYQDVIDALKSNCKGIKYIDSFKDEKLPDVDALYIGGGFPEVFAQELEDNSSLRQDIKEFCESGKPVYAECGGLMYLGDKLITKDERSYEMVGFFPLDTKMMQSRQALGYAITTAIVDNPLSMKKDTLVGHEFHYSKIKLKGDVKFAYKTTRGHGINGEYDGILKNNTLAGYLHLHILSYPRMVHNFLRLAEEIKRL